MFGKRRKKLVFDTESSSKPNVVTITKKGIKSEIDLDQLKKCIEHLSQYPNKEIKTLSGKLKKSYLQLLRYVELLHGNNEYYVVLLDLIKKNSYNKGEIFPWTIGSYMRGCMINTSLKNGGCSPLCAGSIKYDDEEDFCDYPVVTARYEYNTSGFIFVIDRGQTSKSRIAMVYVNYKSLYRFPGFDNREKAWFGQNNIKKIFLYGTRDFKEYFNLYPEQDGEPMPIGNVKARVGHKHHPPTNIGVNTTMVVIILIVIIIFLIFFYAYFRAKNQRQESDYYY